MIYKIIPKKFNPKFEVVGNFIQHNNEIILLHRQKHKPQGNTWGIPSGKKNKGESSFNAVYRETAEETGILISPKKIKFFLTTYIEFQEYDFIYHIFYTKTNSRTKITINKDEHKNAIWISPKNALKLPLIEDLDGCIKLFFNI